MTTRSETHATFGLVGAVVAGALFGAGLVVSQMSNPVKVLAFLDFSGAWDPSLLLVMVGAMAIFGTGYRIVIRRAKPLWADAFHVPARRDIDRSLLFGAALFGLGWGLAGYCPGPALSGLTFGVWEPAVFALAMVAGFAVRRALTRY